MPTSLRACAGCLRHFRRDAERCPFCGRDADLHREASAFAPGRLARGASIGCVALALVACGESTPPPKDKIELPAPEAAAPTTTATTTATTAIATATATTTAIATATATATATGKPLDPDAWHRNRTAQCTPQGQCPPYGGPPPTDELV